MSTWSGVMIFCKARIVLMLAQRLRRGANIKTLLGQSIVFAGGDCDVEISSNSRGDGFRNP